MWCFFLQNETQTQEPDTHEPNQTEPERTADPAPLYSVVNKKQSKKVWTFHTESEYMNELRRQGSPLIPNIELTTPLL